MRWPKAKQGLEGRERAVPAGRGESAERIGEMLQVGEGDLPAAASLPSAKPLDIGAVGALGVDGAAMEPEINQVPVGRSLLVYRNWF